MSQRSEIPAYLLKLLGAVLNDRAILNDLAPSLPQPPDDLNWPALLALIKAHHLERLIFQALNLGSCQSPGYQSHFPAAFIAQLRQGSDFDLRRSIRQDYEIERLLDAFEANQIDYLPLKGIVLRRYYPSPDLRYMTDADILLRAEQMALALQIAGELGYTLHSDSPHHAVLHLGAALTIELHRYLMDGKLSERIGSGWRLAIREESTQHGYAFSPEDLYCHLLAHMARHFTSGGVGLRSLIDLFLVVRHDQAKWDTRYLQQKIRDYKLEAFTSSLLKLAENWFGDDPTFNIDDELSRFILSSGMMGHAHHANVQKFSVGKGNPGDLGMKAKITLELIFPGRSNMAVRYPLLKRAPWLLPIAWLLRAGDVLVHKIVRLKVLHDIWQVKASESRKMREMIEQLDLAE